MATTKSPIQVKFTIPAYSYVCPFDECSSVIFTSKRELKLHQKEDHKVDSKRCLVRFCKKSFPNKEKLAVHIEASHHRLVHWKCKYCGIELKNYRALRKHIYYCHEDGVYACCDEDCPFVANNRLAIVKHYRAAHRRFICSVVRCKAAFTRRCYLNEHQRMVHPSPAPQPEEYQLDGEEEKGEQDEVMVMDTNVETDDMEKSEPENVDPSPAEAPKPQKLYSCSWPDCELICRSRSNMIKHIRGVHFKLPYSMKKQREQNLEEARKPTEFFVEFFAEQN